MSDPISNKKGTGYFWPSATIKNVQNEVLGKS